MASGTALNVNTASGSGLTIASRADFAGTLQGSGGLGTVTLTAAGTTFAAQDGAVLRDAQFAVGPGTLQVTGHATFDNALLSLTGIGKCFGPVRVLADVEQASWESARSEG